MNNDQNKQSRGNRNDNRQRGDRNNGRSRPKTVEMELFFVEQHYGDKSSTPVAIMQDGLKIYPRSPRFNPQVSTEQDFEAGSEKKYTCLVRIWDGQSVADCMPKVWQTLSPEEFLPEEEWRKAIVVALTFRKDTKDERGRPKAFHKGKVVFVDKNSECSLDQTRLYMLSYGGRVAYAHALPHGAGTDGKSKALVVSLGERLGELSLDGLRYVVLKVAQNKSNVAIPKTEKDLVIKQSYKSVYDVLRIAADASEEEIKRAYRAKCRDVHPDAILPKLKHVTIKDEMNVRFFFEAVEKAYQNALDVLARGKAKKVEAPKAETPAAPAVETEASAFEQTIEATATTDSAPAEEVPPQVETTPVVTTPAPATMSQDEKLVAAAALAKISVEEFKTKAPGFQKHHLREVDRTLVSKANGQSTKQPRPAKPKNAPKKGLEALAEMKASSK